MQLDSPKPVAGHENQVQLQHAGATLLLHIRDEEAV
jgi:hypothetical protein